MKKDLKAVKTKRKKYGKNCFRNWGKMGGSPLLLKAREIADANKTTGS